MGKKGKESLGRALIKDRFNKNRHKRHVEDNSMLHTTEVNDGYDWGRLNLQSVTAESSLQEFLSTAELADKEFAAEKLNIHYVKSAPSHVAPPTSQPDFSEPLTLPRRPPWTPGVSAEEQAARERESFLEWRKHLNELQEKLGAALTPYERNLELWRQLWRTLERSDLVLLLLDARNPLLFRSADLESYAADQQCKVILLLNKADLITEYERTCWAQYFDKENVQIVFFSAAKETEKEDEIPEETEQTTDEESDSAYSDSDDNDDQQDVKETENDIETFKRQVGELDKSVAQTGERLEQIQQALAKLLDKIKGVSEEPQNENVEKENVEKENVEKQNVEKEDVENEKVEKQNVEKEDVENENIETQNVEKENVEKENEVKNSCEVLNRDKLLVLLKSYRTQLKLKNPPHLTVGMIGYPNVGKSSTVNVLMQTKKVSVSSMPGHTRHLQSLVLDSELHIVDCPGLVLPAYAVAPDLLLTAVLPIDQMRSWDAAACRLCELVPRATLERQYGLLLPHAQQALYKEVLTAYAYNRGFMTASGQADASRAARIILKDAAAGRLRWAVLPPGCARLAAGEEGTAGGKRKPTPRETRLVEGWVSRSDEVDRSFFGDGKGCAHVKGKPIPGLSGVPLAPTQDASGKPWKKEKKHANKNKREKLRRVYAHLDQH